MIPLVTREFSINFEGKVSKRPKVSGLFLGSCLTSIEEVGCDQWVVKTVYIMKITNLLYFYKEFVGKHLNSEI